MLESLNGALAADAALLSAAERQVIDDAAARLSAVAEGNDADAIEEAIKTLINKPGTSLLAAWTNLSASR